MGQLISHTLFAVDVSGSTAGSIISDQRKTVESIGNCMSIADVIFWNDQCRGVPVSLLKCTNWNAGGGTSPHTVLQNKSVRDYLMGVNATATVQAHTTSISQIPLLVFMTDGEIDPNSVPTLTNLAVDFINLPVIVVITINGNGHTALSNVNTTIASAFTSNVNVMVLIKPVSSLNYYVAMARGQFTIRIPDGNSMSRVAVTDLPAIKLQNFHGFTFEPYKMIPAGHIPIGEVTINNNMEILNRKIQNPSELLELLNNFPDLLRACQNRNHTTQLSKWLTTNRQPTSQSQPSKVVGTDKIVNDLIEQILNSQTDDEKKQLRQKLQARRLAVIADSAPPPAYDQTGDQIAIQINQMIDEAISQITALLKTGNQFSAATMAGVSSNRLLRANIISDPRTDLSKMNLDGAYCSECSICAEVAPFALLLKSAGLIFTDDMAVDFPLAFGQKNFILPDRICWGCTSGVSVSTVTREPIAVRVPLVDLKNQYNIAIVRNSVCFALTNGIEAPHAMQLFLAQLCYLRLNKEWCDHPAIDFMINSVLDNQKSKRSMKGDVVGDQIVSLREAISFAYTSQLMENYFVNGVAVMYYCNSLQNPSVSTTPLTRALVLQTIKTHMASINSSNFTCDYSGLFARVRANGKIPVRTTAILINPATMPEVHSMLSIARVSIESMLPALTLVKFLAISELRSRVSWVAAHEHLLKKFPIYAQLYTNPSTIHADEVLAFMNARFQTQIIPEHHVKIPAFANAFGPSCVACGVCGDTWITNDDLSTMTDSEIEGVARDKRAKHLKLIFGQHSANPSTWYANSIHRATVLAHLVHGENAKTIPESQILATAVEYVVSINPRGDVHMPELEEELTYLIKQYRDTILTNSHHVHEFNAFAQSCEGKTISEIFLPSLIEKIRGSESSPKQQLSVIARGYSLI